MSALAPRRNFSMSQVVLVSGAALLGILGALAFYYRNDIAYDLRLFNAKLVADKFYSTYSGITKNIAYGPQDREKLDVYQPDATGPLPVLIWVYGGGWTSGDKELYAPVAQKLMPENVVVVVPNYTTALPQRIVSEPLVFQQAHQIAQVFAWARKNVSLFNGDPNRIVIGGQSAGAHLTTLVALDPQYLAALNHSSKEICGLYGIAGPYDIQAEYDFVRNIQHGDGTQMTRVFGGADNFVSGSPQNFVRIDTPPILLIHGDADETVPLAIGQNFQNALQKAGAPSQLKIYPGAGHAGLLFDALAQDKPQLVQDLATFAKSCPAVTTR